jgi:hypothetical protein
MVKADWLFLPNTDRIERQQPQKPVKQKTSMRVVDLGNCTLYQPLIWTERKGSSLRSPKDCH